MKEIAITQEQVPSNRGYPGDLYSQLFYDNETNNADDNNLGYTRGQGALLEERIEMVRNPASLFDLKQHGKTAYYVSVKSTDEKYATVSQKLMQYLK